LFDIPRKLEKMNEGSSAALSKTIRKVRRRGVGTVFIVVKRESKESSWQTVNEKAVGNEP